MSQFDEMLAAARAMNVSEESRAVRNGELWHLFHDRRFPAFLAALVEDREILEDTVTNYESGEAERVLASGGMAALKNVLNGVRNVVEAPAAEEERAKG